MKLSPLFESKKFEKQVFPEKVDLSLFQDSKFQFPIIDKNCKITSIGSCFARNISTYLLKNGYNYLIKEYPYSQASAHWEQVFNTACIRQIFEYSFNVNWSPIERWWSKGNWVQDPFRQNILYKKETAEEDFERHRKAAFEVLAEAEIIILTLGLIEVWRDKRDKYTYYRVPSPEKYNCEIHEFHLQTVDECLSDLEKIHQIIHRHNSDVKIIVSVSPIPITCTFRENTDVVSANAFSKSTLRTAAEYFINKHDNVFYFPAYEIVTQAIPDPNQEDNIHPKQSTIKKVMETFEFQYCK